MRDLEIEDVITECTKRKANRRRHRRWVLWSLAVVYSVWFAACNVSGPRRSTCAACRLDRLDHNIVGVRWSEFEESECSRWYAANVEPKHDHIWAEAPHCQRFGIPPFSEGYGCRVGEPIAGFSKHAQVRVYRKFRDPLEAKRLFVRLGTRDRESHRMMEALSGWLASDGPESWDEWWAKARSEEASRHNDQSVG